MMLKEQIQLVQFQVARSFAKEAGGVLAPLGALLEIGHLMTQMKCLTIEVFGSVYRAVKCLS